MITVSGYYCIPPYNNSGGHVPRGAAANSLLLIAMVHYGSQTLHKATAVAVLRVYKHTVTNEHTKNAASARGAYEVHAVTNIPHSDDIDIDMRRMWDHVGRAGGGAGRGGGVGEAAAFWLSNPSVVSRQLTYRRVWCRVGWLWLAWVGAGRLGGPTEVPWFPVVSSSCGSLGLVLGSRTATDFLRARRHPGPSRLEFTTPPWSGPALTAGTWPDIRPAGSWTVVSMRRRGSLPRVDSSGRLDRGTPSPSPGRRRTTRAPSSGGSSVDRSVIDVSQNAQSGWSIDPRSSCGSALRRCI